MVYIQEPQEEEEDKIDASYLLGVAIGAVGFVVLALIGILALSWPLTWLWNVAAAPFGAPTLVWYEFAAGWVVMMILIKIMKKIFGG